VDSGQNSEKPKEKEIDFVADKGNQHLSIQVVFNFSSIKRFHDEIDHLVDYAKASKCYCVTEDDHHPSQPEIEFLTLREFLMKNSL
jgi:predicted AAA+ superfamily ATPase